MGILDTLQQIIGQTASNVGQAATNPLGYLSGLGGQAVQGLMDARNYVQQQTPPGTNYIGPRPGTDAWDLAVQLSGGDPTAPLSDPVNNLQTYMGYLGGGGFAAPISKGSQVMFRPALRANAPTRVVEKIRQMQNAARAAGKRPPGRRPYYKVEAEGPGNYLSERPPGGVPQEPAGIPNQTPTQGGYITPEDTLEGSRLAGIASRSIHQTPEVSPFDLGIGQGGPGLGEELMRLLTGAGRALGAGVETAFKAPGTLISEIARGPVVTSAIKEFGRGPSTSASWKVRKAGNWLDDLLAGGTDVPTDPSMSRFTSHLGRMEPYKPLKSGAEIETPRVAQLYDELPTGSVGRDLIAGATRAFSRPSGDAWKSILGALGLGVPTSYKMGSGMIDILKNRGLLGSD